MIISLNWLKQYTDIDISIDELTTLIGERLVEIEEVINLGEKYKDVLVVKVVECAPLEGSDHLNVTKIDDGGIAQGVERDENGLVQVVCGAPNVKAGMTVAWLPPTSTVPETYGTAEPFVLGAKPLRGVMSNGMLASARELDLYDDHNGILEVDKEAEAGSSFAKLYELDDYLLDIENKSLTHRPDAFGVIGFAREVAGIQGKKFETPEWLFATDVPVQSTGTTEAPTITIADPALSDRFTAVVLEGVDETKQSPVQLQTYLARSGVRPINASVDVSNYLMLLTGQPSHTYDYDKLLAVAGGKADVSVRLANADEKLTLLDGREITMDESDIVIAAGDTAIGLAGAMGGISTIVDSTTKRVLLEVATFDLYHLRSTQMRHGIFSEAITRFTKGIPAPTAVPVLTEAARLLGEYTGAATTSQISQDYPGKRAAREVVVSQQTINDTLGTQFAAEDIVELLENVGFTVRFNELEATVTAPYWREDIHIPEDITEEVGRLAGFDTINLTLPTRDFVATKPTDFDGLRAIIRNILVRAGANEVLTYSFVHGDDVKKAGQNPDNSYRIVNSISPELQYYRQSLTPSLLNLVHPNIKAGYEAFAVFELNKTHDKLSGMTDEDVPVEHDRLALTIARAKHDDTPAYYGAKRYLDHLASRLGLDVVYESIEQSELSPVSAPFEPKRSAVVLDRKTKTPLGVIGEYKRSVAKAWKLPAYTAGFELDVRALASVRTESSVRYQALSRYPGTERDVCFQVKDTVSYQTIVDETTHSLASTDLVTTVEPIDIYKAEGSDTKNVTVRISFVSYNKTLTNEDVAAVLETTIADVIKATDGRVV